MQRKRIENTITDEASVKCHTILGSNRSEEAVVHRVTLLLSQDTVGVIRCISDRFVTRSTVEVFWDHV